MTFAAAVCLAATLLASPASAQPEDRTGPAPSPLTLSFKIPMSLWAAAVTADQVTTFQFRSRYPDLLHEQNPVVRPLENHPAWMVTANSALDAATAWAAYRWLGRKHPRLAKTAFYSAAAYRFYLTAHNIRMMQRARNISAPE